jgi:hypothetical protein
MQREEILAEMKRTAEENGGKPLGTARFEQVTEIRKADWLPYWSRFGDIQRDAGFEANQLNAAYDDAFLLEKLIVLTRERASFPRPMRDGRRASAILAFRVIMCLGGSEVRHS